MYFLNISTISLAPRRYSTKLQNLQAEIIFSFFLYAQQKLIKLVSLMSFHCLVTCLFMILRRVRKLSHSLDCQWKYSDISRAFVRKFEKCHNRPQSNPVSVVKLYLIARKLSKTIQSCQKGHRSQLQEVLTGQRQDNLSINKNNNCDVLKPIKYA